MVYFYIQDLLNKSRNDITDSQVLKIASFLQSLDNNTSTNVIEIDQTTFDKFLNGNTQQNILNLKVNTLLTSKGFTTKNQVNVIKHLKNSLISYNIPIDNTEPVFTSSSSFTINEDNLEETSSISFNNHSLSLGHLGFQNELINSLVLSNDKSKAFIADNSKGLVILDITNKTNPTKIASLDTNGKANFI